MAHDAPEPAPFLSQVAGDVPDLADVPVVSGAAEGVREAAADGAVLSVDGTTGRIVITAE